MSTNKNRLKSAIILGAAAFLMSGVVFATFFNANNKTFYMSTIQTQFPVIRNVTITTFRNNLVPNPDFIFVDSHSRLPLFWNDSLGRCSSIFKCTVISIAGLDNKKSFQISTKSTNKNTWSWIDGKEIDVMPSEQYQVVTHMKLNEFSDQSHIVIQGYNETSKKWYRITVCPKGSNGPLEWHEFRCELRIPENTDKIRPVLNAGWSSRQDKEGVTLFDAININKKSFSPIYTNK